MSKLPTHYQVLGVDLGATAEQIRRAYRAKAKALHPDVSAKTGTEKQFAEVALAYEVLSDRRKRAEYDQLLREQERPAAVPGQAHYTWHNIATEQAPEQNTPSSDFDELYETFFRPHPRTA